MDRQELETRLINFAVLIIKICELLPNSKVGNHLSGQLVRSGTSPALNYGEAQSAESTKDFIHKLQIVLKELRETIINLKIIVKAELFKDEKNLTYLSSVVSENDELISIFVKSVQTARKKNK